MRLKAKHARKHLQEKSNKTRTIHTNGVFVVRRDVITPKKTNKEASISAAQFVTLLTVVFVMLRLSKRP